MSDEPFANCLPRGEAKARFLAALDKLGVAPDRRAKLARLHDKLYDAIDRRDREDIESLGSLLLLLYRREKEALRN